MPWTGLDEHTRPQFERSALLGIDMQKDFIAPGGAMYRKGAEAIVPKAAHLAKAFADAGRPVVHVVRFYAPDGSDAEPGRRAMLKAGGSLVLPGATGAELADGLGVAPDSMDPKALLAGRILPLGRGAHLMYKPSFSAFFRTGLYDFLAGVGVTTVVLMGAFFPNCVRATATEAVSLGLRVVLVPEAIAAVTKQGLAELAKIGTAAASTEDVLSGLARMRG